MIDPQNLIDVLDGRLKTMNSYLEAKIEKLKKEHHAAKEKFIDDVTSTYLEMTRIMKEAENSEDMVMEHSLTGTYVNEYQRPTILMWLEDNQGKALVLSSAIEELRSKCYVPVVGLSEFYRDSHGKFWGGTKITVRCDFKKKSTDPDF